jgi:hypothetical protein
MKRVSAIRLELRGDVVVGRSLAQNPRGVRFTSGTAMAKYTAGSKKSLAKAVEQVVNTLMPAPKKS